MKITGQILLAGLMCLVSLVSVAQDVVPYAQSDVKVDWVKGTDFSKYKTYAWGTSHQKSPDPAWNQRHLETIDAVLQGEGLRKVMMDGNPSLIVSYDTGSKPEYVVSKYTKYPVNEGTLIVELVDPQTKKAVWWGIAEGALDGKTENDVAMVGKRLWRCSSSTHRQQRSSLRGVQLVTEINRPFSGCVTFQNNLSKTSALELTIFYPKGDVFRERLFAPVWSCEAGFDRHSRNGGSPNRIPVLSDACTASA